MATKSDTETALGEIASLGAALADQAFGAQEQAKIKDEILDKIGGLDQDTAKMLLKDARVQRLLEVISDDKAQSSQDPPGTVKDGWIGSTRINGFTKKEWTEADLSNDRVGAGKFVTFTPVTTVPVFWNGLRRQLIADEEITVEKCFKDIYDESRRATKNAQEHAEYLFKRRDNLRDPSMVTAEGARARGMGESGWYVPGGGGIFSSVTPGAAGAAPNMSEGAQETTEEDK